MKLNSLVVSNADPVNEVDVSVYYNAGGGSWAVVKTLPVAPGTSINVFEVDNGIYLLEDSEIRTSASSLGLNAIASWEDISEAQ